MNLCNALIIGVLASGMSVGAHAAQFVGTGTGPVPDDTVAGCGGTEGDPLTIQFTVSGLTSPISTIGVRIAGQHTWMGDLTARLSAPGGSPTAVLFGKTGSTTATGCGDSSAFGGPYNFGDGPTGGWWTAAAAAGASPAVVAAGDYRTSTIGGAAGGGATTSIISVFGGLAAASANGTWTLTVTDASAADTGSIDSAILFIDEPVPVSLQNFSVD